MKIKLLAYSAVAAVLVLAACKDGSKFKIVGTVNNPGDAKKVFLLEADTTQINVVDSVALGADGKFEIKHPAAYENLYKLRIGTAIFDLIAKDGEVITFTTDLKDKIPTYQITGSENSGKIQEFNKISGTWLEKNRIVTDEYQAKVEAIGKETDSLIAKYRPLIMANMEGYAQAVLKFVNENKSSLASFYALSSLDQIRYEQQMINYADEVKQSHKFSDNPAVQRFVTDMEALKSTSLGHKAPDFTIKDLDGKPIKLSDYKGKYVMLDFWASWCGPCRAENPNVVKAYAAYKDKGFNILGISLDLNKPEWQRAIETDKLTWKHGSDLERFDGPTEHLYHIEGIPSNFIIDPQGIIVAKNVQGEALEDFLNKTFNKAK
ncbi:TlpA disulfide reductase family protein [Mucilaginibacter sp. dw_454]|uniref:TlpA disulfide reductase family protein n=1 Tax=Mucilaginibacter sp. dw_454 TaxID=2720079 RepID=UPI001BD1E029|nr:TlpA disulfide reductase family protein [Mucilaginibacter sp. dw_454]